MLKHRVKLVKQIENIDIGHGTIMYDNCSPEETYKKIQTDDIITFSATVDHF